MATSIHCVPGWGGTLIKHTSGLYLLHFFLTVDLHPRTAAGAEVNLSEWLQLPILGYETVVPTEDKGGGCHRLVQRVCTCVCAASTVYL